VLQEQKISPKKKATNAMESKMERRMNTIAVHFHENRFQRRPGNVLKFPLYWRDSLRWWRLDSKWCRPPRLGRLFINLAAVLLPVALEPADAEVIGGKEALGIPGVNPPYAVLQNKLDYDKSYHGFSSCEKNLIRMRNNWHCTKTC